jgi:hypothetical protein
MKVKITKPGNIEAITEYELTYEGKCPACGCEFECGYDVREMNSAHKTITVRCGECYCRNNVDVHLKSVERKQFKAPNSEEIAKLIRGEIKVKA